MGQQQKVPGCKEQGLKALRDEKLFNVRIDCSQSRALAVRETLGQSMIPGRRHKMEIACVSFAPSEGRKKLSLRKGANRAVAVVSIKVGARSTLINRDKNSRMDPVNNDSKGRTAYKRLDNPVTQFTSAFLFPSLFLWEVCGLIY